MGSFNSTTQTQQSNQSAQTGTNTPTEASNVTDFRNSLYPQINTLISNAQKPVYGAAQQAQFTNSLNKNTNAGMNTLASQLAQRTGSVNSGAYASGLQNMLAQRTGAQANYEASVPGWNQAAQTQNLTSALGLGTNFAGRAPVGNTTSGTSNGTSNTNTSQTPSVFSDILGVGSAAMGAYTGLSGMGALGGLGQTNSNLQAGMNASGYYNPTSSMGNMSDIGYTPGFTSGPTGINGFGGY